MTTEARPAHSPLGASGAERWMNCPGSVALIREFDLPESDEPEYRSMGTAAHEAACKCLKEGLDAYEVQHETFGKHKVDEEMAGAIQVYLDECREVTGDAEYVELGIDAPDFHKDFYGTLDRGQIIAALKRVRIRDFKYGAGIAVDVEWNPQVMYYAYGLVRRHPEIKDDWIVDLGIVQPRGYHPAGPVRVWDTLTVGELRQWAETDLLNAMHRTAIDNDLLAGEWCRFCAAKLVCPLMVSLFGAAMQADPKAIIHLSDEALGRSFTYAKAVKHYVKALEEETYNRVNRGVTVPLVKLVNKRADRVYKAGAPEVFRVKFGGDAFTKPALKSPAEMEKIGPDAKSLVKQYAYTPTTGTTVALMTDKRPAVTVKSTQEAFAGARLEQTDEAPATDIE